MNAFGFRIGLRRVAEAALVLGIVAAYLIVVTRGQVVEIFPAFRAANAAASAAPQSSPVSSFGVAP